MEKNNSIPSKISHTVKMELKKEIFYEMLRNGSTQKEAAQKACITEKTACNWAKNWNEVNELFHESIKNIALRLRDVTVEKDFLIIEARKLTSLLKELEQSKFVGKSKL